MIISHTLRFVYVGPPKTGSTSMHRWLRQGALFDPRSDIDTTAGGGQHDWRIPPEAAGYYIIATTRDRVSWLDSLWRQSCNDAIDYPDRPLLDYAAFLQWRVTAANGFYWRELEDYYPSVVDCMLHLEQLAADVAKLPFTVPLDLLLRPIGHENRNHRNPKRNTTDE